MANWLYGYFQAYATILLNGAALPQQSTLNVIGPAGSVVNDVVNNRTTLTLGSSGGGGGAVTPQTPVNAAGITSANLAALVAANVALGAQGAYLLVDCSSGPVAIGMPVLPPGTPITIYVLNGNPATHAITLTGSAGQTIQHMNGPTTATYTTAPPTLQDTPSSSGTSAVTNVWVFDAPGYLGTTTVYRAIGATGSYMVN